MDSSFLNRDGQPVNRSFNAKKVLARQQAELIGILRGVACDSVLSPSEAKFVYEWMNIHKQTDDRVTYTQLLDSLQALEASTNGAFDEPKQLQGILKIINKLVNGGANEPTVLDVTMDVADVIAPSEITFLNQRFCFTGKLKFGTRSKAHHETEQKGGIIVEQVSARLNYLICGDLGSRDWSQSTFGEKIRAALSFKNNGSKLLIVEEHIWAKAL
jgi:NAD-dependent DNA ligase